MDYQYIEGFSIYPSRWLKRYKGLPGYPQMLFPMIVLTNRNATSRAPYVPTFDAHMLQLLNREKGRKDVAVIQLPHPYPASEYHPRVYRNDIEPEFKKMRRERMLVNLVEYVPKEVGDIILTFEKETDEKKKKTQWGLSLQLSGHIPRPIGQYRSLGYEILRETGESKYLQVYEKRVPVTRVIFGYFKDGLLQEVKDNPDHYTEFFRVKKGKIWYSGGVFTVLFNNPSELPLGNSYLIARSDDMGIPVPYKPGFVTHMLIEKVVDMSCTPPRHREWFRGGGGVPDESDEPDESDDPDWYTMEYQDEIRRAGIFEN